VIFINSFYYFKDNNFGRRASDGGANLQMSQKMNCTYSEPSSKEDLKKVIILLLL
jgi:hypothetical protein